MAHKTEKTADKAQLVALTEVVRVAAWSVGYYQAKLESLAKALAWLGQAEELPSTQALIGWKEKFVAAKKEEGITFEDREGIANAWAGQPLTPALAAEMGERGIAPIDYTDVPLEHLPRAELVLRLQALGCVEADWWGKGIKALREMLIYRMGQAPTPRANKAAGPALMPQPAASPLKMKIKLSLRKK